MAIHQTLRSYATRVLLTAALAVACVSAYAQADAAPFDAKSVKPPVSVELAVSDTPQDPDALTRWMMPLADALASVKPAEMLSPPENKPPDALPQRAQQRIEQADKLMARGELFSAIRVLREAEALSPQHHAVTHRLGVAYSLSGNRVRGAAYLEKAIAQDPGDAVSLLLLSQHAASAGELAQTLTYSKALEQTGIPKVLADRSLSQALSRAGYARAATELLQRCIESLADKPDPKPVAEKFDPLITRELAVLSALKPELRVELGDLYLCIGQPDRAKQVYTAIDPQQVSDTAGLFSRLVYLALKQGDVEAALRYASDQLMQLKGGDEGRQAIGYLVTQGISRERIAKALDAKMQGGGVSLPLLTGLAEVTSPAFVIDRAVAWLASGPQQPSVYREVAGLATYRDDKPEDAVALATLLQAVLGQMQRTPSQSTQYLDAVLDEVDAPISLLRALKQPVLAQARKGEAMRPLLKAIIFEKTQRNSDAIKQYQQAMEINPALADPLRVPLAKLQIQQGEVGQAIETLKPLGMPTDWDAFSVMVNAIAQSGQPTQAIQLVDNWRRTQGDDIASQLLRAELIALSGFPSRSCDDIFRLIQQSPKDIRVYEAGLRLIDNNLDRFSSFNQARNLRGGIVNLLQTNLPDAPRSRIEQALDIYQFQQRDEGAVDQALALLNAVVRDDPGNALAWLLIEDINTEIEDYEAAAIARQGWFDAGLPTMNRMLLSADHAVTDGEMERASGILRRMLALEQEGVLPGPAMTEVQAGATVELLQAAEPDKDFEAFSLTMLRRFPNSVQLNNALGYQWSVKDKNLLQAKAMIERALAKGGANHAVLDSLAWVQYKLGQIEDAAKTQRKALDALEQAKRLTNQPYDASKAVLNDHMGDILFRKGDTDGAVRYWQIALGTRVDEDELMRDPELRTLAQRTQKKLKAIADEKQPPLTPIPGPESHGKPGHPADLPQDQPAPAQPPEQGR